MKVYDVGGIEVVAATLAGAFEHHGHHVVIATFKAPDKLTVARTDPRVKIYTLGDYKCSSKSVSSLRNILVRHQIQVVINQWGLPLVPCKTLNKAKEGLDIKTIAVYHNQIDTNARIKDVEIALDCCHNPLKRCLLEVKKQLLNWLLVEVWRMCIAIPTYIKFYLQAMSLCSPSLLVSSIPII